MSDVLGSLPPELTPASRRLVAGYRLATALALAALAIARLAGLCLAGVAVERLLDGAPQSALIALVLALAAAIVAAIHRPPALR